MEFPEPLEFALTEDAARLARVGHAGFKNLVHEEAGVIRAVEKAAERGFSPASTTRGSNLSRWGRTAAKAAPFIATGFAAKEFVEAETNNGRAKAVASNLAGYGGAMAGAEAGAAWGALAGPIGVVVGGIAGGLVVGGVAAWASDEVIDNTIKD